MATNVFPASERPLPSELQYHCFFSYEQSSGLDLVGRQHYILTHRGFKCWWDMQFSEDDLNLEVMEDGLRKSMVYCLFLSKDIFPSVYIEEQVRMAVALNKPIMLLQHPDTGTEGYWTFGDYITRAPNLLRPYFGKVEIIQLRRRHYEEECTIEAIVTRLESILIKLLPEGNNQLEKSNLIMPSLPSRPLPDGLKYHCFLSYKHSSAIDLVGKQYSTLVSRGFKCWYDMQFRGDFISEALEGISGSMVYCLFLSKDVFPSYYIEKEVEVAISLKKPIMLFQHPDTGTEGYWSFRDYIARAPNVLKPYFSKVEIIPIRRRYYEEESMTEEIVTRLETILIKSIPESINLLDKYNFILPPLPSRPLPEGLQYHCFLSYKQSSAIDVVGKQYSTLTSRGFICWYDMQFRGDLTFENCLDGLKSSVVYCLHLSKDVFPSYFIEQEVEMAIALKKPILLFLHPDTGLQGYWSLEDYIRNAPDELKPYFEENESIQLRRRYYEEEHATQQTINELERVLNELLDN